jgi:hypothetical protein
MDRGLGDLATMTGARAGGAPNPGRGTGNVPHAPGVASGRFGPQPPSGQPSPAQPPVIQASSAPAPPPSGGPPSPGAAPPSGGLGLQSPINSVTLQPQIYFELMGAIMSALIDAANAPEGIV